MHTRVCVCVYIHVYTVTVSMVKTSYTKYTRDGLLESPSALPVLFNGNLVIDILVSKMS